MRWEQLEITGYRGLPVPNRFGRQEEETTHLAVFFPGGGYNVDMALLFYPRLWLMEQGADILLVEYNYQKPEYQQLSEAQLHECLFTDVRAICTEAFAQRQYERITLIGKSLGTNALADLLEYEPRLKVADFIWLTPLLTTDETYRRMQLPHHGLFVIGTKDHANDQQRLDNVLRESGGESLVIEGADHGLHIEGDILATIRAMEQVMRAIQQFLEE
jgi:hypothetical protein